MKVTVRDGTVHLSGDIRGSDGVADLAKALCGKVEPTLIDSSRLKGGNSGGLFGYVEALIDPASGPVVHVNMSFFFYSQFNLAFDLLRPIDTIRSMSLRFVTSEGEPLEEIVEVGKDVPLQASYEDYNLILTREGKAYELDSLPIDSFAVLTRIHSFLGRKA